MARTSASANPVNADRENPCAGRVLGSRAGERRCMRMGRTIAEKILAKNALDGRDAMPGAIPRTRLGR